MHQAFEVGPVDQPFVAASVVLDCIEHGVVFLQRVQFSSQLVDLSLQIILMNHLLVFTFLNLLHR